jgi:dTDP-4-dehydrorhamnose 3,5-epimerase
MTMRFTPTPLPGVVLLQPDTTHDTRGSFARLSCVGSLAAHGITFVPRQTSLSCSPQRSTLRGLHFQEGASAETKIVYCIAGTVFDVALDLRPASPTFRRTFATELSAANGLGLLVPVGCAHGLLTLTDDATVLYQIDQDYHPDRACGVRWNDPAFEIRWPSLPEVISDRDATWPDFVA